MKKVKWGKILEVAFVIIVLCVLGYLMLHLDSKKRSFSSTGKTSPDIAADGSNSLATPATPTASTLSTAPATAAIASQPANVHGVSPTPTTETPLPPPATILDNARVAIHNYQDRFGENPVGDNTEITAALMGKNPKQVTFITPESGLRVNEKGEMIDAWGTPFFFHQLSGQLMEIHSAGQDRKMWTLDDQVTR